MKRYVIIALVLALFIALVLIAISNETPPPFVEVEVMGVRLDAVGSSPVVLLADKEGKKALPIWVGLLEASAIDKELRNNTSPRPMTHDLLYSILAQAHVKVKEVRIVDIRNNTYYATLFLNINKGIVEVDARPSDAIVIALKSKTPIFVSAKILDEQGIALAKKSALNERFGIRVQELTPALASHFNYKGQKGVLVAEVLPGSASESSGIKAGDIISKVNSTEVGSVEEFQKIFDSVRGGDPVRVGLFRDDQSMEIQLTLKP
ncbi:MAG TPA: bifunctional nuclease domain-containing protein [Thermodesulfobacteriota bacterium]|nr:bifunctional nuclease domain-containing protein [Thermodesulfobacteriota bacterium]